MEDCEILSEVIASFQEKYPHRKIGVRKELYSENEILTVDGQDKFCITGFCLLYNLQRLCQCLADELI